MFHRFEIVTADAEVPTLRFCDHKDVILLGSAGPVASRGIAAATIDWLRVALLKDWLYRIDRDRAHHGPRFSLCAPNGVTCVSPTFSSSDRMERAIEILKTHCRAAPVLSRPADLFGCATDTRLDSMRSKAAADPCVSPGRASQPAAASWSTQLGSSSYR